MKWCCTGGWLGIGWIGIPCCWVWIWVDSLVWFHQVGWMWVLWCLIRFWDPCWAVATACAAAWGAVGFTNPWDEGIVECVRFWAEPQTWWVAAAELELGYCFLVWRFRWCNMEKSNCFVCLYCRRDLSHKMGILAWCSGTDGSPEWSVECQSQVAIISFESPLAMLITGLWQPWPYDYCIK